MSKMFKRKKSVALIDSDTDDSDSGADLEEVKRQIRNKSGLWLNVPKK